MEFLIADLHNDVLSGCKDLSESINHLNSKLLCCALFTKNGDYDIASLLNKYYILNKWKGLILAFENLHFLDKFSIDVVISNNPLYAGLTWNDDNCLSTESGLTKFGIKTVRDLERNNIIIDTAHLNRKSFYQLADIAEKPIINSHTCFDELNSHNRNVTNEQIRLIVNSGGIIGLTFVKPFLGDSSNIGINDIVRHIDYFVSKFGEDKLCLASDYYGSMNIPLKIKNYKRWGNLVEKLSKIGYNECVIKKIFYYNFYNFYMARR